jgi:hypothetical protein
LETNRDTSHGFETATLSGNQKTVAFGNTLLIYDYSNLSSSGLLSPPLRHYSGARNPLMACLKTFDEFVGQFSNKLFANTQSGEFIRVPTV